MECLQKLCTDLDIIQKDIDFVYHSPVHLQENIIQACRNHLALASGLVNLPQDVSGLVNNLYIYLLSTTKPCTSLPLVHSKVTHSLVIKMPRSISQTVNIGKANQISDQLNPIANSTIHLLNSRKSALFVAKKDVGLVIILNKNVMIQKQFSNWFFQYKNR